MFTLLLFSVFAVFCVHHTTKLDGLCLIAVFIFYSGKSSSSSGITVLGRPQSLPKLSSNILDPATYASNALRPCSSDLPRLSQSTLGFPNRRVFLVYVELTFCKDPLFFIVKGYPRHPTL
jgi:hypothetical protein